MIFTKRYGLGKLRLITRRLPGLVTLSPHRIYRDSTQYRVAHSGEMPRLLVRTDVSGKRYRDSADWWVAPRTEFPTGPAKEVKQKLSELKRAPKMMYIVHPTRKREDVEWAGGILVMSEPKGMQTHLILMRPDSREHHWREIDKKQIDIPLEMNGGVFHLSAEKRRKYSSEIQQIISRTITFLNMGVQLKQLKLNNSREFTIWFNTWKDSPGMLEFFDFQERRKSILRGKK